MKNLYFSNTIIKDGFWKYYQNLMRNVTVHSVYERFYNTGRFDIFRCDWKEGMENKPHRFWESDVAKWIEGVAYLTELKKEPELEKIVDETIDLIEKNQREDGYFNSYFQVIEPDNIYSNRDGHELYTTGHLIEAAIAYHKATGKDKLLKCMLKNVDCIYNVFVVENSASFLTPGHQEIELALLKLYDHTGYEKALSLAKFFIDKRGNNDKDDANLNIQTITPLRELKEADGHCVRAGYLYSAMAKLSSMEGDKELKDACDRLFYDIVNSKMTITGGIGSVKTGKVIAEAFSYKYDLQNIGAYNETCASIALSLFAHEMQQTEINSLYADIIEIINYNGFISGLSLDGDKFFYSNPMEIDCKKYQRTSDFQAENERVKVFNCSCCPPNVVRIISSIQRFMYTQKDNTLYCNQFAQSETKLIVNNKEAKLIQHTDYPLSGNISFEYFGEPLRLMVRIPYWCCEYEGKKENGYAEFNLKNGDKISINLPMNVHFMEANPNVQDDSGRFAVMRGPIVYAMEGIDNGENLRDITLLEEGNMEIVNDEFFPVPVIVMDAQRRANTNKLYSIKNNTRIPFKAKLIPYLGIFNRGATDMLIWTMVK